MSRTLNQIISDFQTIAQNHKQINSFGYGDIWDIATSGDINYPMMWVTLEDSQISGMYETLRFNFLFMDIVKGGRVNELEVLSDQLQIAKDVIIVLKDPNYDWTFTADNVTLQDFTERFVDSVSGWTANIELKLPFTSDRCAVPYDGSVSANNVCPVVTIFDSNGNVLTTVSAGGSYTVTGGGGAGGTINVYLDGNLQSSTSSTDLNAETVNILWI